MPTTSHVVWEIQDLKERTFYTHEHWEIHRGNSYTVEYDDSNMNASDYFALGFQTSGAGEIHMFADFALKAEGYLDILENASWSGGQTGTQLDVINRNRNNANTPSILTDWRETGVYEASGNIVVGMSGLVGTSICHEHVYAPKQAGNQSRGQHELILQSGVQYAFKLNAVGGSNAGSLILNWYEED